MSNVIDARLAFQLRRSVAMHESDAYWRAVMICIRCSKFTTRFEAHHRIINPCCCGSCGGTLKEYYNAS